MTPSGGRPGDITLEDVENDPELREAITRATTAEHTLVCMLFDARGVWDESGYEEQTGPQHDRFEYDGRDWFVLFNDSEKTVAPGGLDTPPGKARLVVNGVALAKLHQDETGWMYDPDTGEPLNAVSVHHEYSGGGQEGNATAKTWLLRTVEALRWRVADLGGYDPDELAPAETMLDESVNRLQEVSG